MPKVEHGMDDAALDALFATARANPPLPSGAVIDRMCTAALAAQPTRLPPHRASAPAAPATPRRGLVAQLLDAIGGWPALAGLATAGITGVWIGLNPPATLTSWIGPGDLSMLAPYDLSQIDEEG